MDDKLKQTLEIIDRNKFISIKDLTRQLGVSRGTTDRYLQKLEENRLINRVQGGAVSLQRSDFDFVPDYYYSDGDEHFQERTLIAQKAVEIIGNQYCIFIGGGNTTLHLARELRLRKKPVSVLTNSLPVALVLAGFCPVNIVGVTPTDHEGILIGPVNGNPPVNAAFISAGAINEQGFYNATPLIIQLECAFMKSSEKTVILASSEVYSSYRPYQMCSYDKVNVIITSAKAPNFIKKKNIEVCYV